MSLPKFPDIEMDRDNSLNLIISSIAMEEAALSHIIEAESEKINFVIERAKCCSEVSINKIIEVNKSVDNILEKITDIQILLKNKLKNALAHIPKPPCCDIPKPPCCDIPKSPCCDIPKSPCCDVPKPPCCDIPKSPCCDVPKPPCCDVPKPPCCDTPKPPCCDIPKSPCCDVPKPRINYHSGNVLASKSFYVTANAKESF